MIIIFAFRLSLFGSGTISTGIVTIVLVNRDLATVTESWPHSSLDHCLI